MLFSRFYFVRQLCSNFLECLPLRFRQWFVRPHLHHLSLRTGLRPVFYGLKQIFTLLDSFNPPMRPQKGPHHPAGHYETSDFFMEERARYLLFSSQSSETTIWIFPAFRNQKIPSNRQLYSQPLKPLVNFRSVPIVIFRRVPTPKLLVVRRVIRLVI